MQMKTKIVICILLIFSTQLLSQDFSVGFNYSGLISGKNYESLSFYNLEAEYEFMKNILSAGLSATVSDSRINKSFIKNPPPDDPYESSLKVGVQTKYFPYIIRIDSLIIKPFIGIEMGIYNSIGIVTYLNMPSNCAEQYFFGRNKAGFFTNLNFGSIFYPEQPLSVIFGFKFQINNPTVKYDQPICSETEYGQIGEIRRTEKVNLNVLVWNIGFRVNF